MKRKCIIMETDKKILQHIKDAAKSWYEVLDAPHPVQALQLVQAHADISVFITQHGEDRYDCIDLLEQVRLANPKIRRVVTTSFQELGRIVHGLHNGTIQKIVQKPINLSELQIAIVPLEAQQGANNAHALPRGAVPAA